MAIFSIKNRKATKIPPTKVKLEKEIQTLFENNLEEILNINFVKSEHTTGSGGRIDTLGIDNNGAPTIIEYKRSQNDNVINQGLSYLKWLLDHKDSFEALLQKNGIDIDIDWESPRVICIAESYNKFDLDTADILPINIELLRYRVYENNILLVESEIQPKVRISTSKMFKKGEKIKAIQKETKHFTVSDHLQVASKSTTALFETLRERLTAMDNSIIEEAKAKYIAYKLTTNFVDVVIQKNAIKIFLNMPSGKLDDPHKLARDLAKPKKIGHWGNGDYEVKIDSKGDLEKASELIKQSYEYNR